MSECVIAVSTGQEVKKFTDVLTLHLSDGLVSSPVLGRITSLIDIHGHVHLSLNRLLYLLAALGMRGKER